MFLSTMTSPPPCHRPEGSVVKVCRFCNRAFDLAAWRRLQLVGYQEDEVERIELRNCDCRIPPYDMTPTLAIVVDANNDPCPEVPL